MAPNPEATRRRLVDTAERLFAERGLDGVSLREITAAAGVRNASALQYHFGGRPGLVRAVVAKHRPHVEAARHALLDAYEAPRTGSGPTGPGDPTRPGRAGHRDDLGHPPDRAEALRTLAGALVRPMAAELVEADGGREHLRIMAQLVNRPPLEVAASSSSDPADSINRWRALVGELLPEVAVARLHRRFTAIRITFVELARRAEQPPARDDRLFTSHLVDLVTAVLDAPVSEETAGLLAASGRRRIP
jgi:AcrR family transcriptional regulator